MVGTTDAVTVVDCAVTGNGGAGLVATVPNQRMSVENLTSEGNSSPDAYGTAYAQQPIAMPVPAGATAGIPPATKQSTCRAIISASTPPSARNGVSVATIIPVIG